MIKFLSTITVILLVVTSCTSQATIDKEVENIESGNAFTILNPEGTTLSSRFNPPVGFERTEEIENSFQSYLRNLPLKKKMIDPFVIVHLVDVVKEKIKKKKEGGLNYYSLLKK